MKTFGDLRISDEQPDGRPEQRWRLVLMAADVVDAVRASISVPYLFEPSKLRHPGGESLLVDGGLISNFPIDAFDRTVGRPPRWPAFGQL